MTVAINQKPQKESTLDKLMKGLAVAKSVTGVAVDYTNLQKYYDDKSAKENNIVSSKDLIEYGKDYNISDAQSPGSFSFGLQSPEGVKQVYLTPKDKKPGALSQLEYASKVLGEGWKEVTPGTKGSVLMSHLGPSGETLQSSLLPPKPKSDEKNLKFTDPNRRLAEAPAEVKSKVGLIANALNNMTQYEQAFSRGESPTRINANTPILGSFVSDTKLTAAQRNLDEAVGRLNSGGVIGKEELVTFRAMGPRPGDSDDIKVQKIANQRQFLEDRLAAFGFSAQDMGRIEGFDQKKLGYDSDGIDTRKNILVSHQNVKKKGGSLIPEAIAGGDKINANDLAAVEWLKSNPEDPDAPAIRTKLKAKGLVK